MKYIGRDYLHGTIQEIRYYGKKRPYPRYHGWLRTNKPTTQKQLQKHFPFMDLQPSQEPDEDVRFSVLWTPGVNTPYTPVEMTTRYRALPAWLDLQLKWNLRLQKDYPIFARRRVKLKKAHAKEVEEAGKPPCTCRLVCNWHIGNEIPWN